GQEVELVEDRDGGNSQSAGEIGHDTGPLVPKPIDDGPAAEGRQHERRQPRKGRDTRPRSTPGRLQHEPRYRELRHRVPGKGYAVGGEETVIGTLRRLGFGQGDWYLTLRVAYRSRANALAPVARIYASQPQ